MTIQSKLNQNALDMLTEDFNAAVNSAAEFESNQMRESALREICNNSIRLTDMNSEQISDFSNDLLNQFKFKNWIQ